MARDFEIAGPDDYMEHLSGALISGTAALPLTMAAWILPESSSQTGVVLCTGDGTSSSAWVFLKYNTDETIGFTAGIGPADLCTTSTTLAAGTWGHVCGIGIANNDWAVYLNNGGEDTSTTTRNYSSFNEVGLGMLRDSSPSAGFDGCIAEAAAWSVALNSDERQMLADGFSPLMVRPDALIAYWPLYGNDDPEPDYVGTFAMTNQGSFKAEDHPVIYYPVRAFPSWPAAADGATATAGIATFDFTALNPRSVEARAGIPVFDFTAINPRSVEAKAGVPIFDFTSINPRAVEPKAGVPLFLFLGIGPRAVEAKAGVPVVDFTALDPTVAAGVTATAGIATFDFAGLNPRSVEARSGAPVVDFTSLNPTAEVQVVSADAGVASFAFDALNPRAVEARTGVATAVLTALDPAAATTAVQLIISKDSFYPDVTSVDSFYPDTNAEDSFI